VGSAQEERLQAVTRTSLVGALVNVLLALVKIVAGLVGQSYALIVDGVHSMSDLLSDAMVWIVGRQASEGPDQEHPYGHARFETFATLVLGTILAAVAVGIAFDALQRLTNTQTLLRPGAIALVAAVVSILAKEWLYWFTLGYARRVGSEMLRANAWHHRSDAVSSIVVLVGVTGTLLGLDYLDAIAAIVVCAMIAKIAWDLIREAIRELVDTGLKPERVNLVRETICSVVGVRDVHMLRTRRLGGNASADVHVLVDPRISVSEGHMISLAVEERLKANVDEMVDVTIHIDPEDDADEAPGQDLPPRSDVLERLNRLWARVPQARTVDRIVLHYLGGRIDVEILLPFAACRADQAEAEILTRRLREAAASDPVFREVQVYFGVDAPESGTGGYADTKMRQNSACPGPV